MFLPNSHSFSLVRSVISKPVIQSGRKTFLPNSHSFSLVRSVISKPVIQSGIQESAASLSRRKVGIPTNASGPSPPDSGKPTIGDKDKRTFLKAAGIAGASIIASLFLPKKADALIMGSSPTTGVVGVKNSTNARINPATEETVSSLLKPADLDFDGSGYLNVNVQDSALTSTASTETTLQAIAFGGKKLTLRLVTVGSIDYVGEAEIGTATNATGWRIKRIHNNFDANSNISITWASGSAEFNKTFDNYAGYTYS